MLREMKKALLARFTMSHSFKQKCVNTPRFKVPHLENVLDLKRQSKSTIVFNTDEAKCIPLQGGNLLQLLIYNYGF